MKDNKNSAHCYHCKKDVTFHSEPVDHRKQLLITVFTLGLWLPIWLCITFGKTRLCDVCGKPLMEE